MCCPTCIELGRTTFFCGQECFTKSWKTHCQVHDVLRKTAAAEKGANHGAGGASSSTSVAQPARPQQDRGRSSVGRSALTGGVSLATGIKKPASVAAAAKTGMLGSIVDQAWGTLFGAAGALAVTATRLGSSSQPEEKSGKPRARSRSRSENTVSTSGSPSVSRPKSYMQMGICALAVLTLLGGALLYREHQRYVEEDRAAMQRVHTVEDQEMLKDIAGASDDSVVSVGSPVMPDSTAIASGSDVDSLRLEIHVLHDTIDRQDKMLKYVMGRFEEKTGTSGTSVGSVNVPSGYVPHEAVEVDMSKPEFVSGGERSSVDEGLISDSAALARRGEALKRRKNSNEEMGGFSPGFQAPPVTESLGAISN